jgi:acyl-ACP thioesterase
MVKTVTNDPSARNDGAAELLELPASGRRFSTQRKVRLGDVTPKGRLRLDAVARYLQDVANDDARDAAIPDAMWWILRRTMMQVSKPCAFDEVMTITTWCSGVDSETGAPRRVDPTFHEMYDEAARGRKVRARSLHREPFGELSSRPWPVRYTDLDVVGHVNNAIYWTAVEESMAAHRSGGRVTADVEYRSGVDAHVAPTLVESSTNDEHHRRELQLATWQRERVVAVEAQFVDRFLDVVKGPVRGLLDRNLLHQRWVPATNEFLDG